MMLHAFTQVVLPVFAVVAIGWGVGRWSPVDPKSLNALLLYVSVPALLFDSLARRAPAPEAFGRVALAAAVVCLGLALLAGILAVALRLPRRGLVLTSGFMNAGNFGLPFALLAWGQPAIPYAVTFYVTMAMLQSTVGIWVAWGNASGWREVFRLPMIYAATAGLAVNWLGLELPTAIARPAEMVAQTAIPLMLISLGMALQRIRPAAVPLALGASLLRIVGGVTIAWAVTEMIGLEGVVRNVVILSGSMPAAVMNVVLAERYDADKELVATTVLFSTLMAVLSVPAVITMLR